MLKPTNDNDNRDQMSELHWYYLGTCQGVASEISCGDSLEAEWKLRESGQLLESLIVEMRSAHLDWQARMMDQIHAQRRAKQFNDASTDHDQTDNATD